MWAKTEMTAHNVPQQVMMVKIHIPMHWLQQHQSGCFARTTHHANQAIARKILMKENVSK